MNSEVLQGRIKVTALVSDAFGSFGGIAKFNRDLLTAIASSDLCDSVEAIPRLMPLRDAPVPTRIRYRADAAGSKLRFVFTALRSALLHPAPGLLLCGHINLLPVAALAKSLALTRPRLMLMLHGIDAWSRHRSWAVRRALGAVDKFVAVSNFTRTEFLRWSFVAEEKTTELPNCVDLSTFSPGPKCEALLSKYGITGQKVMLTLGRLERGRDKGIDAVLDVWPAVRERIPHAAYLVVGDGSDKCRLERRAADLGAGAQVRFAGRVSEAEKLDHYRLGDAFVLPGTQEGFGIVYLEALACGLSVLGSRLDGSREALLNGALGVVVDPRNRAELCEGICAVLERGKQPPPVLLRYFSLERFCSRVEEILLTVLGRGRRV